MQEYPGRLAHDVPGWIKRGALYHVRVRIESGSPLQLTDQNLAAALLNSARFYHAHHRWYCSLFLLMPDHLHALLAFSPDNAMSSIIGTWKGYQAKRLGIHWQSNYFDHRIRDKNELDEKAAYIRMNPVVKGPCLRPEDWPWLFCGEY